MSYVTGTVLDDAGNPAGGRIVRLYRRDTGAFLGETTSVSSSVAGDSNFDSVVLLLSGNGANNGTTITDSSISNHTATLFGDTKTSTAQSKFGGSSIYLDGTGDKATFAASSDFAFGTGDFTVEMWARLVGTGDYNQIIGTHSAFGPVSGSWRLANRNNSDSKWWYSAAGGSFHDLVPIATLSNTTWYHLAASRSSGTLKLFVDGTETASATSSYDLNHTGPLQLGFNPREGNYVQGYFNGIRITKGVARYTTGFTAPTVAFPACSIDLTTGGFCIPTSYTGEVNVVCLDDAGGTTYNDLILRTTPV